MIGIWRGYEENHEKEGVYKEWVILRNADGTSLIKMKIIKDGETREGIGPGVWWTYKNKYYEFIGEQSKSIAV